MSLSRNQRLVLALVCMTSFMLILDLTIVAVALPDIQRDLSASFSELQWVVDAYSVTLVSLLLAAATLGDRLGYRRIFILGAALFSAGSLACGLATSGGQLDLFRAFQGIGGSLLYGIALPMIAAAFPDAAARVKAIGLFGAMAASGAAIGPLAGGTLTDLLGWRWIFLINIPVGLVALALAAGGLERAVGPVMNALKAVDWTGVFLSTGAIAMIVYGLINGQSAGWADGVTLAAILLGGAVFAVFVVVELRSSAPMADLRLYAVRRFTACSLLNFVFMGWLVSFLFLCTLYLQNVEELGPFKAGLVLAPIPVVSFLAAPMAIRLIGKVPVPALASGVALLGCAGAVLATLVSPDSGWAAVIPAQIVSGVAMAVTLTAVTETAIGSAGPERMRMASGMVMAGRQLGMAFGIALFGTVFSRAAAAHARDDLGSMPGAAGVSGGIGDGQGILVANAVPGQFRDAVEQAAREATLAGWDLVHWIGAVVLLLTATAVLLLTRPSSRMPDEQRHMAPPG